MTVLTKIFNVLGPSSVLLGIKSTSIAFSFIMYSICIFYFKEVFALTHASFMLVFGVFKSGAGFEAISSGASALDYVTKKLITRIVLSITWLYLFAVFFDAKLTLLVLLSIPVGLLWLKSFDGHILGNNTWSIVYSLIPSITVGILGICFLIGIENTVFTIDKNRQVVKVFLVVILVICFLSLRGSLKNTLVEILHATVSPLMIHSIANNNLGANGSAFIVYKIFEGLSQIVLFILSSGKSKKIVEYFTFLRLTKSIFIVFTCSLLIGNLFNPHLNYFMSCAFIFCYFVSSFFVVKFKNHTNIILVFLVLAVITSLNKIGFVFFHYTVFTLPVFLFLLHKNVLIDQILPLESSENTNRKIK